MNLNEYFDNPKKLRKKIIVISARDEASRFIKCFINRKHLKLNMDIKYRDSYVAVVDLSREFAYELSQQQQIECSYQVGKNFIDIISAGFASNNKSSIKVGEAEYSLQKTGLNFAIFNYKNLKLIDKFNVNTYVGAALTINRS